MRTKFGEALQKKTFKENETIQERGKKRFRERLAEEQEAEREIKQYTHEESETLDNETKPTRTTE